MMHKPKRVTYMVTRSAWQSWGDIFSKPQDVSAEIIVTGELFIHNRFFLNLGHPHARDIKPEMLKVPVLCLLVRHKDKGDYLIDCGLDKSYQSNPHGDMRGVLRKLFWPLKSFQKKGQDIGSQLAARGIRPKGVFLTHLHADHCAGVAHLSKDVPIVVGQGEPFYSCGPFFYQDSFQGVETIFEIDFSQGLKLPPLGDCVDLLGDGSIWAIATPGHRPGHLSYLINGHEQVLLYTGDACDIRLGFECVVGPGFGSHNKRTAQRSLEQLVAFKGQNDRIKVVFGHER